MVRHVYSASLSQSQGRSGYSIIFRHPARRDDTTGKFGVRVRRGLGTRDLAEAERLREELNQLLADPKYHDIATREDARQRFDDRIVDIFFDGMVPEGTDFASFRDSAIPLPHGGQPDGYRHVLFLGTTGAGKTTLVRQLIGTDPMKERFPSTSTSKTTIHDTEIVFDNGPWRAVVTFVPSDEVRGYLYECISKSVLEATRNSTDSAILQRLLEHVDQRFRFNYILGSGPKAPTISDFEDELDDPEEDDNQILGGESDVIDLSETNTLLLQSVARIRELAHKVGDDLRADLDASDEEDERVVEEIFEEELDNLLRGNETFHEIADALMDEIEKRFSVLPPGKLTKTRQGWPLAWQGEWPAGERPGFLKSISQFSSNYAPLYGRLLTPLVNGVRVAGPFSAPWTNGPRPKLVLLDGEGLGHTVESSASVSTSISRRIETSDAVLLVDNAMQPMQAAPQAAIREVISTGNGRKLILAFTHFDEVKGDNLPDASAKARHVLASAENVLAAFGEELGPHAERMLRQRIQSARFFLAGLHEPICEDSPDGKRTLQQLRKLLKGIDDVMEKPQTTEVRPVYDRANLTLAIYGATHTFRDAWRARLGLDSKPGFVKEHWSRIKALNRRLASMDKDEYDSLKPVADLRRELMVQLYPFIQNPLNWDGGEAPDDDKQGKFDALADALSRNLLDLSTRRIWKERIYEWERAYYKFGRGSTFVRAGIIENEIYDIAAPIPGVTPSPDRNQFLWEVISAFEAAAAEAGAVLR